MVSERFFLNIDTMILIKIEKYWQRDVYDFEHKGTDIPLRELFVSFWVILSNHNLSAFCR